MGHWEEERGEFKLPTADFARIRGEVAAADLKCKTEAFEMTQKFWSSLTAKQKRDKAAYNAAVYEWCDDYSNEPMQKADQLLRYRAGERPSRVLKSEMDFPTNKTLAFHGNDVTVAFDRDRSSVSYRIEQDRHTIENAYGSAVLPALLNEIRKVRWTRGTGGRIWGDNEYAAEARMEHGSDSDLTQEGFGPLGAESAPGCTKPWRNPKGESFFVELKPSRTGVQARVKKGVPAGGQFGSRYRPESGVSLGRW